MNINIHPMAHETIVRIEYYLSQLAHVWGERSDEYRDTAVSWSRKLGHAFHLAGEEHLGRYGEIWRDGDMAIGVTTSYGLQAGIIPSRGTYSSAHPTGPGRGLACLRHKAPARQNTDVCEKPGDDGQPCYIADAPIPMTWSAHS